MFVHHMKIGANTPEKGDDTDCCVQACLVAGSLMRRDSSALMNRATIGLWLRHVRGLLYIKLAHFMQCANIDIKYV